LDGKVFQVEHNNSGGDKMKREENTIGFIKQKIKVLNLAVLLSITTVLLLVVKFVYSTLGFLTIHSILATLFTVALLSMSIYYLSRQTSKAAIQTIEEYSRKLNLLRESSRAIHEIRHSDFVMEHALASCIALTGAEDASLLLLDGDKIKFGLVMGDDSEGLKGMSFPKSKGIVGWVIDNGEAVLISDTMEDNRHYSKIDKLTGYSTRSILCAPIRFSDGVVGAVELVSSMPNAFSAEDKDFVECFCSHAALSINEARYREDQKNFEVHLTNILVEATEYMSEKKGHTSRVTKYALMVGRELHLSREELETLHRAAKLHDIGFLRIRPEDIKSPLDYQTHSLLGYNLLNQITFYKDIAPLVRHHHERYDGMGYPDGLKGKDIPLLSRIIHIAEAFDAMTSPISYKRTGRMINEDVLPDTVDVNTAINELKAHAGTQFDPFMVDLFVNNINESDYELIAEQGVFMRAAANY
jgi:GAF domain-containing protein